VLLWGDVRLGNVVFDPEQATPVAILDWDMASVGPIELDLAWHLALEQVQTELTQMEVPGFGTRDEAVARVGEGVGRELDDLEWYEVFALARASAISTRIAVLHQRAGQRSMFKIGEDPTLAAALRRLA
jgi:aminoglycoside phosphotransferase (APT) family kinase protein